MTLLYHGAVKGEYDRPFFIAMISAEELQTQIDTYLIGSISFEELEDWLVLSSRHGYLDNPEPVRQRLGEIRYLIMQLVDGDIDETEFQYQLRQK